MNSERSEESHEIHKILRFSQDDRCGVKMGNDCIFCKIANGTIPAEKLLDDDHLVAFKDINPAAPVHILIVPKKHIATLNDAQDAMLLGRMLIAARDLAKKHGVSEEGYRTIVNCNRGAGQEVFHLHMHLMGGRRLGSMG